MAKMSENSIEALRKHRERVKSGEIPVKKSRNPQERFEAAPNSRAKAIAAKCWDCSAFQREEIRECPMTDCALWHFRPYK